MLPKMYVCYTFLSCSVYSWQNYNNYNNNQRNTLFILAFFFWFNHCLFRSITQLLRILKSIFLNIISPLFIEYSCSLFVSKKNSFIVWHQIELTASIYEEWTPDEFILWVEAVGKIAHLPKIVDVAICEALRHSLFRTKKILHKISQSTQSLPKISSHEHTIQF